MSARAAARATFALVTTLALATPARAGAPSALIDRPYVFSDGAVNLVILPYRYHSADPSQKGSRLADQIPLLLQANGLLQMLRYGSVGSLNFVDPTGRTDWTPESVQAALTDRPFRHGKLAPGHGLILVWGTLYEEGGELEVQTTMRLLRGGTGDALELKLPDQHSMRVQPSTGTLTFEPRALTGSDIASIGDAFRSAVRVHRKPSPLAPVAPFTLYDPWGKGSSYSVMSERGGWLEVLSRHGEHGWIRADLGGGVTPLSASLPEVEFIGLAAGYLRARMAADQPGDRAPGATLEWVRESLRRYLAAAGEGADTYTSAVGRQLVALTACALAGDAEAMSGGAEGSPARVAAWELADGLATEAAGALPDDAEAQRLAAALTLRADAARGDAGARGALVERRLARAALSTGSGEAGRRDLQTLYTIAARPGGSGGTLRLNSQVASRRLAGLSKEPTPPGPTPGPTPVPGPHRLSPRQPALADLPEAIRVGFERDTRVPGVKLSDSRAVLSGESRRFLDQVADAMRRYPEIRLVIEAHTELGGAERENLMRSERWAQELKAYLIQSGVESGRVAAVGKGESQPLTPEDSASGRELNRRVVIRLRLD